MELMMKKTLIAGISAFALMLGASGTAVADPDAFRDHSDISVGNVKVDIGKKSIDHKNAVSVQALQQVATGVAQAGSGTSPLVNGEFAHHGMEFGPDTFRDQVLDVNNFALGINQAQQGAVSIAVQGTFNSADQHHVH